MASITPEIRQALAGAGDDPVRIDDPVTHQAYVILKLEVYDHLKAHAGESGLTRSFDDSGDRTDPDLIPREMYPLLADLSPEDWEDASNYDDSRP